MLPMPGGKNELRPVTLKGHSCLLVTFFAGPLSQSPRSLQSNHRRINWQSAYAKGSQPLTAQRIISFQVSAADLRIYREPLSMKQFRPIGLTAAMIYRRFGSDSDQMKLVAFYGRFEKYFF